MIFSILVYAASAALALLALIVLGYKPRTEINKTFHAYRRTPALRKTVTAWCSRMVMSMRVWPRSEWI